MAALLTSVLDDQDKVAEYIGECRSNNIKLLPPDVNESGTTFTVSGDNIRFGLAAVKGVGVGVVESMLAERVKGGAFTDFADFCQRMFGMDLNRRAVENLIKCGAFDSMGYRRSQLLSVFGQVLDSVAATRKRNLEGQLDLFGMVGESDDSGVVSMNLPDMPELSKRDLMAMEKETTGLYLSGHPMDEYRQLARRCGATPIGDILGDFGSEQGPAKYRDEQKIVVAGVISRYQTKTTRNNSLMAYVTLEDDTGTMELLVFSRTLSDSSNYIYENSPILVSGKISVRDEKEPQILCDQIRPLGDPALEEQAAQRQQNKKPQGQKLYLKIPCREDGRMRKIKLILSMFPGEGQAILYFEDTQKRLGTPCVIHPALVSEMKELLGEGNVVVK